MEMHNPTDILIAIEKEELERERSNFTKIRT